MNKKLNRKYISTVAKKEIAVKIENHFHGNFHGSEVDRAVALMPELLQEDAQIGISFTKNIVEALNKIDRKSVV